MAVIEVIGGITTDFLAAQFGVKIPWLLGDILYAVLVYIFIYLGIKVSTRAQLTLVAISVTAVTLFCLSVIARGGASGNTLAAFSPSSVGGGSGLFFGLFFAILIYVGFESAANLGEETSEPKRNIPRAILLSLVVIGAYQVMATYALDIGYGINNAGKWATDPTPLFTLGNKFGNGAIASLLQVMVVLDVAAVGLATAVSATHGLFAMARDRRIPAMLARVSTAHGTPLGATTFYAVLGVVIAIITFVGNGVFPLPPGTPTYFPMFGWMAGIGSLALVIVYLMVCVGGIKALRAHANVALVWIIGIVGALVSLGAIVGSVYPVPPFPSNLIPYMVLAWAIVGIILALVRGAQMTREAPSPG
jgi:amino acid transporter